VIKSYKNFPLQLRNGLGLLADIPSRYDPLTSALERAVSVGDAPRPNGPRVNAGGGRLTAHTQTFDHVLP
jgi:hypothetical protein